MIRRCLSAPAFLSTITKHRSSKGQSNVDLSLVPGQIYALSLVGQQARQKPRQRATTAHTSPRKATSSLQLLLWPMDHPRLHVYPSTLTARLPCASVRAIRTYRDTFSTRLPQSRHATALTEEFAENGTNNMDIRSRLTQWYPPPWLPANRILHEGSKRDKPFLVCLY